ncbi:MAG: carbamoyltransferase HypF [Thermoprotei archaeon]|nr:MAG: carbamoyltransferase HypF [Thermoprotei archaeon]
MRRALLIRVTGLVQGVGFRPFIHRLASRCGVSGYVKNLGGSEVEIWVEGEDGALTMFTKLMVCEKPPPAELEEVNIVEVEPLNIKGFRIVKSGHRVVKRSQLPPDIGVCSECMKEVLNPESRWYRYPFNSCAWCGPRFSMMYSVPYDRENTSMREFPLCPRCLEEYDDPLNERRFHAQGISCPKCGPRLKLLDGRGREVECSDPLIEAAKLVDEGLIVAIKGVGGFHLAALASSDEVVAELRRRKRRAQKPFALMALDVDVVKRIANPNKLHLELLTSPQKPIVLVPKRSGTPVSELVAPGLSTLGIMLPYTPLHYLLLLESRDKFLIMTSGNRRGLPICTGVEAVRELKGLADYFLVHNRAIVNRVDDSVIRLTGRAPQILRRARGYAPRWLRLPFSLRREVVALGAHLSNAGAVAFNEYVVPTQYVGDMDYKENIDFLMNAIRFLERCYRVKASVIASDAHPTYTTTHIARVIASKREVPHLMVQHHHAHIASAMASNKLPRDEVVVGVAVDGAGYGLDGTIWGGEVLLATYTEYERVGHLEYLPLPGGDRATRFPSRIVAGLLSLKLGKAEALRICEELGLARKLPGGFPELRLAVNQARSSPLASSTGRFLDAVSAILGVCWERTYEGEPAMKLEAAADCGSLIESLRIEVEGSTVMTGEFLVELVECRNRHSVRDLAYTAQIRLGEALGLLINDEVGDCHFKVVVSGGAAVNEHLVKGLTKVLKREVILPRGVPSGDGGIAVGQSVVAGLKYFG